MPGRIGSSEIEPHTPVTHAGGSTSTPQSEITGFNETLHNTAPRPTSSVYSQNSEIHPTSVASEHAPAAHTPHTEADTVTAEPKAKPAKSKSDTAKDFGDKFDKILKPLTVTLGSTAQIASLISFGQAQEARNKDSSSSSSATSAKDTGTSGDASGTDASGTTGQLPDLAPIPSQQTS
ncbi:MULTISPECIES: hypothetical protein [Gluconobacter]|uniref:Uncharacterized protein n=1 Tax=Gluconobacter albidus TaxID=318683 RepID=A0AAW3QX98_9PROT|nr:MULTISPECIES: hypothetical protein [Gluconobacter]AQS91294.1 hypothetical protein A0U94_10210 [Gluconobacter albidus]KXV38088.1 hypothetical protein AD941_07745 [Gluconobacter albidus]MBS1026973.1 hypothetical protein [Gluconobacter albidus]OUI84183.1 hypothetical protein HK22_05045 [Gluconobacter sp. DsW_056]GBQ84579.1 hypothetical protein AA3250_0570 [Gluconobacter albidus NBRC 3250]